MKLAIIGMPASGKSSVGKQLAAMLQVPFYDSDTYIEETTSHSINAIFEQSGASSFRALEQQAIATILEKENRPNDSLVIALGGGSLQQKKTERLVLQHCLGIWLKPPLSHIKSRISYQKRPRLTDLPVEDEIDYLYEQRKKIYKKCANIIIDIHSESIQHICDAIMDKLQQYY